MKEEKLLTAVISSAAAMTCKCSEISRNFISGLHPSIPDNGSNERSANESK